MKAFLTKFTTCEKFYLLILAVVSFIVMMPVLIKGVPFGYDLPHHYQCAQTFYESIRAGDFYPSWSLNRNFGFGGMETRLYPPISHYSLALFYLVTGNWHIASWLTFTFYTFVGCLGVYLWAKEYLPAAQAVFAGCLYALLPYHLNQLYNTFFFAEFVGSSVLPFTFLFVARVCKRGKLADVVGLAISFAVLILTHLPLTVIGSICFGIYALTLLERGKIFSQLSKLALGVSGALGASSFFWTKVLLEKDLMAKTIIYPDPWLDYRLHFLLTPIQTFEGELQTRIYETATFFYDLMFLYPIILVLACTIPFFIWERRSKINMKGVWLILGVSVFLTTPFSRFIWDRLTILQEVQFPWRWLAIICIVAPVIAASQINFLIDWFQDKRRPLALIIGGAILAVVAFSGSQIIRQAPIIEKETVTEYINERVSGIGFTFWWTIWTRKEAFDNKEKVFVKDRKVDLQRWTATSREFQVGDGEATSVRIATFYHPNWKATVNYAETEVIPDENGAMLIAVPNKNASVKLNFVEPTAVKIGQWLSGALWLCFSAFGLLIISKKIAARRAASKPDNAKPVALKSAPFEFWSFLAKLYGISENRNPFLILLAVSLLTLLPMILIGVFDGGDLYQHIQFATTFQSSITDGNFYPSWGGNENIGYGSLGVRFYPPAVPFLLGLTRILSGNWHTANCLVFLFLTLIGSYGVYLWAKEYLPSSKAIWAGVFFILMPYHLIEIHNASMYAEFAGVSVISFSFLFLTRVCRNGKFGDVLGLAVSYAVLILTHLPSTVIGSLSLFGYALLILPKSKIFSTITKLAIAVCLGVCASSVYWSKMVFERDWVRMTKFWQDDHFDYHINFLLTSPWLDTRQLWFFNLVLISMALLVIGCVVGIYYKKRAEDKIQMRGLIGLFFGTVFMTTILSQPLWATLPYLPEIQFPWRWLTVSSVCGSVLAAIGVEALSRLTKSSQTWEKLIKSFIVSVSFLFIVIYGLIWIGFQLNYIPAGNYEGWVTQKSQGMGAEWFWTTSTKQEAFNIREKVIAGERTAEIISWKPEERIFTVEPGNAIDARIATLFYPHWHATVNNQPTDLKIADDGSILVPLPAEKATVKIWFEEPRRVKSATYLSAATWLVFLLAFLFLLTRKKSLHLTQPES